MAKTETITCDICGKARGEVNHWWMFSVPHVLGAEDEYYSFEAIPWMESEREWKHHACGQECLTKAMSLWMQKQQNFEKHLA